MMKALLIWGLLAICGNVCCAEEDPERVGATIKARLTEEELRAAKDVPAEERSRFMFYQLALRSYLPRAAELSSEKRGALMDEWTLDSEDELLAHWPQVHVCSLALYRQERFSGLFQDADVQATASAIHEKVTGYMERQDDEARDLVAEKVAEPGISLFLPFDNATYRYQRMKHAELRKEPSEQVEDEEPTAQGDGG